MDADDNKGYAYSSGRVEEFSRWLPFRFGQNDDGYAAAGTTIDEMYVWHELLNSQLIWQFYIKGGTLKS